ncbi:MAG: GNAT family N-acetyltransferase [Anaerolineales bacterium]
MPPLTDRTQIQNYLETDRPWSLYALGDLAPGFRERAEWHAADGALILLYRAFETPVLFTLGPPDALRPLLNEIGGEREMYLSIRPEVLPLVKDGWSVRHETRMWRMALDPARFQPIHPPEVARLSLADLPALQQLFADGQPTGEAPDFFDSDMLAHGVFSGVWEGEQLVAVAGTHLVAPELSVAAVGNVYTRRDRRGRGLAAHTTSAVTAGLLRITPRLRTIGLNVNQENGAARRVYERLGYARYCAFYEGVAAK